MNFSNSKLAVVLDIGTTNAKVVALDKGLNIVYQEQQLLTKSHPKKNWVEQNADEIFSVANDLLEKVPTKFINKACALGLTNQRESAVLWDKNNLRALAPVVSWEDNRSESYCKKLRDQNLEQIVRDKTGLMLNTYPSASKFSWLINHINKSNVNYSLGTLDSWLISKFTGNYFTDITNASRTMLFNIRTKAWDKQLCNIFNIDINRLAKVLPSKSNFGKIKIRNKYFNIKVVMGDQQASMYAAGTKLGTTKLTYGTGIFAMKIIGSRFHLKDKFITTLVSKSDSNTVYALEANVANAAARVRPILNKDKTEIDRLMVELAQETTGIINPLIDDSITEIIVDGGISQNDLLLQTQANLSNIIIRRQTHYNGTSLGIAKAIFEEIE